MSWIETVVSVVWVLPILSLCMVLYGYTIYKLNFKITDKIKKIIIQITTIGNFDMTNNIIDAIRKYGLDITYDIWVITESPDLSKYEGADIVLQVPKNFQSVSAYKGRALDFSSQYRKDVGMTGDDIKILYLDDDSLPSKEYIEKCFLGDYDIMEGIIQPKRNYWYKILLCGKLEDAFMHE